MRHIWNRSRKKGFINCCEVLEILLKSVQDAMDAPSSRYRGFGCMGSLALMQGYERLDIKFTKAEFF